MSQALALPEAAPPNPTITLPMYRVPALDEPTPLPPALPFPSPAATLGGLGGYLGFGLVALAVAPPGVPFSVAANLLPLPMALASTQITLVVLHQWLALHGRPSDLPRATAGAWADGGRFALGLIPLLVWFATTGDPAVFALLTRWMALAIGGVTLLGAAGRLRDALPTSDRTVASTDHLVLGWFGLTAAIFLLLRHQFSS